MDVSLNYENSGDTQEPQVHSAPQSMKKRWLRMSSCADDDDETKPKDSSSGTAGNTHSDMPLKKRMMLKMKDNEAEMMKKRVSLDQYYKKKEQYDLKIQQIKELVKDSGLDVSSLGGESSSSNLNEHEDLKEDPVEISEDFKKQLAKKEAAAKKAARVERNRQRRLIYEKKLLEYNLKKQGKAESTTQDMEHINAVYDEIGECAFEETRIEKEKSQTVSSKVSEDLKRKHHPGNHSQQSKHDKSAHEKYQDHSHKHGHAHKPSDLRRRRHSSKTHDNRAQGFDSFIQKQEHKMLKHHQQQLKRKMQEEKVRREAETYDLKKVQRADAYIFGGNTHVLPLDALRSEPSPPEYHQEISSTVSNDSLSRSRSKVKSGHSSVSDLSKKLIEARPPPPAIIPAPPPFEPVVKPVKKVAQVAVVRPQASVNQPEHPSESEDLLTSIHMFSKQIEDLQNKTLASTASGNKPEPVEVEEDKSLISIHMFSKQIEDLQNQTLAATVSGNKPEPVVIEEKKSSISFQIKKPEKLAVPETSAVAVSSQPIVYDYRQEPVTNVYENYYQQRTSPENHTLQVERKKTSKWNPLPDVRQPPPMYDPPHTSAVWPSLPNEQKPPPAKVRQKRSRWDTTPDVCEPPAPVSVQQMSPAVVSPLAQIPQVSSFRACVIQETPPAAPTPIQPPPSDQPSTASQIPIVSTPETEASPKPEVSAEALAAQKITELHKSFAQNFAKFQSFVMQQQKTAGATPAQPPAVAAMPFAFPFPFMPAPVVAPTAVPAPPPQQRADLPPPPPPEDPPGPPPPPPTTSAAADSSSSSQFLGVRGYSMSNI